MRFSKIIRNMVGQRADIESERLDQMIMIKIRSVAFSEKGFNSGVFVNTVL